MVIVDIPAVTETGDAIDALAGLASSSQSGPWIEDEPAEEEFAEDDIFSGLGDLSQVEANSEDLDSTDAYSPAPKKKRKRKTKEAEPSAEPAAEKTPASPLLLLGAMFFGGLAISVIVMLLLSGKFSETSSKPVMEQGPAELDSRGFSDTDDMLAQLTSSLYEMETLLKKNNLREFMVRYAPMDQLQLLREAEIHTTQLPTVPRRRLLQTIGKLHLGKANALESGWRAEVVYEETVEAGSEGSLPGYGGDIDTVLQSAITDLKAENFATFVRMMFPESAQLHIEQKRYRTQYPA